MGSILSKKEVNILKNMKVIIRIKNLVIINKIIIINIIRGSGEINIKIIQEIYNKLKILHNFFHINKIYNRQILKSYNLFFYLYFHILVLIYFKLLEQVKHRIMIQILVCKHCFKNWDLVNYNKMYHNIIKKNK